MYKFLEHEADIGISVSSDNLNKMFEEGATALFEIMTEIKNIKPKKSISLTCSADDTAALFIEWLNALLAQKDIENMFFSKFEVTIKDNKLKAIAYGEEINIKKHKPKIEVKAATYSGLKFWKNGKFNIQCVVDV